MSNVPIPGQAVASRLRARIPHGWAWKESLSLLAADGTANVIFSSEPLGEGVDLDAYARQQGVQLARFEGYRLIALEDTRVMGGRPGKLLRFEWSPPGSERVTQIQICCVEGVRGYTATATTTTGSFRLVEQTLQAVLESLFLGDPTPQRPNNPLDATSAVTN